MNSITLRAPCPIWIALDTESFNMCADLVMALHPHVEGFKIHSSVEDHLDDKVRILRQSGAKKIWWDRKAEDTPRTAAAIAKIAKNLVDRFSVHAGGGIEMMMAAVEHGPKEIAAITDLSSLSEAEIGMLGGMPTDSSTLLKAQWASLAGVTHLVCSGKEVGTLNERRKRSLFANGNLELYGMTFVVVGTRTLPHSSRGSQRRSTTAMEAIGSGADELVIGSEVWEAQDPLAALMTLYERCTLPPSQ